jgi:hypothetical protein
MTAHEQWRHAGRHRKTGIRGRIADAYRLPALSNVMASGADTNRRSSILRVNASTRPRRPNVTRVMAGPRPTACEERGTRCYDAPSGSNERSSGRARRSSETDPCATGRGRRLWPRCDSRRRRRGAGAEAHWGFPKSACIVHRRSATRSRLHTSSTSPCGPTRHYRTPSGDHVGWNTDSSEPPATRTCRGSHYISSATALASTACWDGSIATTPDGGHRLSAGRNKSAPRASARQPRARRPGGRYGQPAVGRRPGMVLAWSRRPRAASTRHCA